MSIVPPDGLRGPTKREKTGDAKTGDAKIRASPASRVDVADRAQTVCFRTSATTLASPPCGGNDLRREVRGKPTTPSWRHISLRKYSEAGGRINERRQRARRAERAPETPDRRQEGVGPPSVPTGSTNGPPTGTGCHHALSRGSLAACATPGRRAILVTPGRRARFAFTAPGVTRLRCRGSAARRAGVDSRTGGPGSTAGEGDR